MKLKQEIKEIIKQPRPASDFMAETLEMLRKKNPQIFRGEK